MKQTTEHTTPVILCLSHLGWDFVWQRPQHILSRLARHYPVLYVNEPELSAPSGPPYLKQVTDRDKVSAWQPMFPDRRDVLENWRALYVGLVQELLVRKQGAEQQGLALSLCRPLILWFYTPVPYYFLDHFPADLVVYDVMDELANFKGASGDLPEREAHLLCHADLVFTGGLSMYEARQHRHHNIHLFRSGVEPDHFAQAQGPDLEVAAQIAHLPRPILGYYGVIDERIDLELLRSLAVSHPDWSIVMLGPVRKIDRADLPVAANIFYVDQQPYASLPGFLKGFDVCLMPFAINEATRYISPTKTLEFMAAHKPVVSTAVPDVARNWSDVVSIARGPAEFAAAIHQALAETEEQAVRRAAAEQVHLDRNSWDNIADEMDQLLRSVMQQKISAGLNLARRPAF